MQKVLLLDGYNLIYRARYSFQRGPHSTIFSFFRSLRPLIEKFDPDKVYFVIEGYPKRRMTLLPEYKGTRVYNDKDDFQRQKRYIIKTLKDRFPVEVVRHPDHECDDVLANLITYRHADDDCIVVSTDTDFIQLLNQHTNVQLYNPIRKGFVSRPNYDYVVWKSLKGDDSDNIAGFHGIGTKRATTLALDETRLEEFLSSDETRKLFDRNYELIRFFDLEAEMENLELSSSNLNWNDVREQFVEMKFFSMTNHKSWGKFITTFEKLEGYTTNNFV
jgi:5'-3' exonuclease